ncbi:unnamed protein product [Kuraishia capsulata CBS 1993]|uniref:Uncharacterized protein n=1 Tax=Kuraishia capsulata CBS 1993 TaxID=1382522 RepID=W6ML46_9ASCO|nr:uncharacterized protein KUCA_T00002792001 [Kuraishia capsulata CBS 1993]CDK26818.1 unnamed protein product [Kuraishia capsulata CBS 1993]
MSVWASGVVNSVRDKAIRQVDEKVMPFGLKLGDFSSLLSAGIEEDSGDESEVTMLEEPSVGEIVIQKRRDMVLGERNKTSSTEYTVEISLPSWLDESAVDAPTVAVGVEELARSFDKALTDNPEAFQRHYASALARLMDGPGDKDTFLDEVYLELDPEIKFRLFKQCLGDSRFVGAFRNWAKKDSGQSPPRQQPESDYHKFLKDGYGLNTGSHGNLQSGYTFEEFLLRVIDSVLTIALSLWSRLFLAVYPLIAVFWLEARKLNQRYEATNRLARFSMRLVLLVLDKLVALVGVGPIGKDQNPKRTKNNKRTAQGNKIAWDYAKPALDSIFDYALSTYREG